MSTPDLHLKTTKKSLSITLTFIHVSRGRGKKTSDNALQVYVPRISKDLQTSKSQGIIDWCSPDKCTTTSICHHLPPYVYLQTNWALK